MKLPRVRFTLQRMLVGLAVIAIGLWAEAERRHFVNDHLRERYHERAWEHHRRADRFRQAYRDGETNFILLPHGPVYGATRPLVLKWAQYYENLTYKYKLAASHPWEPVPPDPPPPEVLLVPPSGW